MTIQGNNIKHIYFKRSVLSKLYDDPSVKTRGNIDLYVDINEFNMSKSLLLDNGYIIDKKGVDCPHHIGLKNISIVQSLIYRPINDKIGL